MGLERSKKNRSLVHATRNSKIGERFYAGGNAGGAGDYWCLGGDLGPDHWCRGANRSSGRDSDRDEADGSGHRELQDQIQFLPD